VSLNACTDTSLDAFHSDCRSSLSELAVSYAVAKNSSLHAFIANTSVDAFLTETNAAVCKMNVFEMNV
jgi:hypothetical protein